MLLFPLTRGGLRLRGLDRSRCGCWCGRRGGRRCMSCLRNNLARRLRACGAACKRQQGDVARALDGHAEPALVARANSGHAARQNLAAFLDELREDVRALIVDEVHLLDAELADFLLTEILPLAARASAGTARTTATRSAFAARTAMAAATFAARGSTVRLCLFRFLCHTILPFSQRTEKRNSKIETRKSAGCGLLRGRSGRRSRNGGRRAAARTPRGALFALSAELFLALQVFVEAHGQILDDHVLDAEAAFELRDEVSMTGANLLVDVNALAMLGHAIGELARAPVLGLLDLSALFRAGVLDAGNHFLDFVLRRGRPRDKNQIVQAFFHDDLFPHCADGIGGTTKSIPGNRAKNCFTLFPALPLPAVFAG